MLNGQLYRSLKQIVKKYILKLFLKGKIHTNTFKSLSFHKDTKEEKIICLYP